MRSIHFDRGRYVCLGQTVGSKNRVWTLSAWLVSLAIATFYIRGLAAQDSSDKLPEPDGAAQEKAEAIIRATFKNEYAKRDADSMQALATKLFLGVRTHALSNRYIDGDIRAFRLSKTVRYTANFDPPPSFEKGADTLVLLDFSAAKGRRIPDLSGRGHDGLVVGARWVRLDATGE